MLYAGRRQLAVIDSGYKIKNSVRMTAASKAYFSTVPATPSSGKKFTLSFWKKHASLPAGLQNILGVFSSPNYDRIAFTSTQTLQVSHGGSGTYVATSAVFNSLAVHNHFVVQVDTDQAVSADRIVITADGVVQALSGPGVSLGAVFAINTAVYQAIGRLGSFDGEYFDGFLSDFYMIAGQSVPATAFGKFVGGAWKPIRYAPAFGPSDFFLEFQNSAALGTDTSGPNGWTPNNIISTDQSTDTPTSP